MKACPQCRQSNPEDARFCLQCGALFESDAADKTDTTEVTTDEQGRMRTFIGPHADRYLAQFKKFTAGPAPRFALTWHWPAFLFDPFLWFLYRKMYLYAFVYAIGPVVTAMLTGDITVGIVWRVIAGASANYIYFWHVKEHLAGLRAPVGAGSEEQEGRIREAGGVQPYVIWVGVALHIFLVIILLKAIQEGSPDGMKSPRDRLFPTPGRNMKTQALVDLSASPSVSQPPFLRQLVGVHLATGLYLGRLSSGLRKNQICAVRLRSPQASTGPCPELCHWQLIAIAG
ncbi:MAG: DUF2628 domain-containing protein [Nitrospirae bacterium]|nr:DUF2628 domain-containing protein [Nitrospirota bacterium]